MTWVCESHAPRGTAKRGFWYSDGGGRLAAVFSTDISLRLSGSRSRTRRSLFQRGRSFVKAPFCALDFVGHQRAERLPFFAWWWNASFCPVHLEYACLNRHARYAWHQYLRFLPTGLTQIPAKTRQVVCLTTYSNLLVVFLRKSWPIRIRCTTNFVSTYRGHGHGFATDRSEFAGHLPGARGGAQRFACSRAAFAIALRGGPCAEALSQHISGRIACARPPWQGATPRAVTLAIAVKSGLATIETAVDEKRRFDPAT